MATTTTTCTPRHPLEAFHRRHSGSNGRQDTSETSVAIPFHGSCSRCHHFHINHPFTFSLDSAVHTRLSCEKCDHLMFGLGRASTQNTLASVESGSTFLPRACADQTGQQQQQSQPPAMSQVETITGTSGLGLLTTITERKSPAPSRSTSNVRSPTRTLSGVSRDGGEADGNNRHEGLAERGALPKTITQEGPVEQALGLQVPQVATLQRLRTIGRRFKRRFSAKSRHWNLPRIGLKITYPHRDGMTGHPSASTSNTEVASGQGPSDNVEGLVNETRDDTEDRHAPLRAQRREITLAREREYASFPKCECGLECPCINGSLIAQPNRTETPENIHIPRYLFDPHHSSTGTSNSQPSQTGDQGLDLSHIGGHFDSSRTSSSADESSSAAENGPRRFRLSQGSTLWSNGSSISLRARRPLVSRASSMPVGTRAQHLAGVRIGSHNSSSTPGSGSHETSGASASLDEGSPLGRTSHPDPSRNSQVSSQEGSTGLANPPSPQPDESLVDGVNPGSHTPIPDGDEVTPTPHSGIRVDGNSHGMLPVGADGLSSALHDLANGDMTDREI